MSLYRTEFREKKNSYERFLTRNWNFVFKCPTRFNSLSRNFCKADKLAIVNYLKLALNYALALTASAEGWKCSVPDSLGVVYC